MNSVTSLGSLRGRRLAAIAAFFAAGMCLSVGLRRLQAGGEVIGLVMVCLVVGVGALALGAVLWLPSRADAVDS